MDGVSALFAAGDGVQEEGGVLLRDAELGAVERGVLSAVEGVKGGEEGARVLLVLDGLDMLLAATEGGALGVGGLVADLREVRRLFATFLLCAYG